MMQNCEPYGRAMEGGGGLRLIKHIHTHNGEVGQRGEGGGEGRGVRTGEKPY